MKNYLLVFLLFVSIPVLASYTAQDARRDSDVRNNIDNTAQYPTLLAKVEAQIKQDASDGMYTSSILTDGYRTAVVRHVVRTLIREGYHANLGNYVQGMIFVSWERKQ